MGRLRELKQFLISSWSELKKTTWPSPKEIRGTTIVVLVTVMICAAYLWVVDIILNQGMNYVLQTFSK